MLLQFLFFCQGTCLVFLKIILCGWFSGLPIWNFMGYFKTSKLKVYIGGQSTLFIRWSVFYHLYVCLLLSTYCLSASNQRKISGRTVLTVFLHGQLLSEDSVYLIYITTKHCWPGLMGVFATTWNLAKYVVLLRMKYFPATYPFQQFSGPDPSSHFLLQTDWRMNWKLRVFKAIHMKIQ